MIHPTSCINEPPYHLEHRMPDGGEFFPSFSQRASAYEQWHPCDIADSALVEALCVICMGVERPTRIGEHTWLMSQVHIGHDTTIGDDCIICPMTSIAGHCEIGNGVRIDQGVTIRPFIKVGDGARLGMGAVVTKDVPPGEVWVGNPAHQLVRDRAVA